VTASSGSAEDADGTARDGSGDAPDPGAGAAADSRPEECDRGAGAGDETGRPCPLCGAAMGRRHCKYVCPRHGVVYDCSDTFW
jgi:predicted RNA-binding Zn-ribbon protein involved in translation (DUF1610 family)